MAGLFYSVYNYGDLFYPPTLFFKGSIGEKAVAFYSYDDKVPSLSTTGNSTPPKEYELWVKTGIGGGIQSVSPSSTSYIMSQDEIPTFTGSTLVGKIYHTLHCRTNISIGQGEGYGWCSNNGGTIRYYNFYNSSGSRVRLPAGWTGKLLFFGQNGNPYNKFLMNTDAATKFWSGDNQCFEPFSKLEGLGGNLRSAPGNYTSGQATASGKIYRHNALKVVTPLPNGQTSSEWSSGVDPTTAKGIKMYFKKDRFQAPANGSYQPGEYLAINCMGYYSYTTPIAVAVTRVYHNTDHGNGDCNNAYWHGLGIIVITTNHKLPEVY